MLSYQRYQLAELGSLYEISSYSIRKCTGCAAHAEDDGLQHVMLFTSSLKPYGKSFKLW